MLEYTISSCIIFLLLAIIWTNKNWFNIFIKFILYVIAGWGFLLISKVL